MQQFYKSHTYYTCSLFMLTYDASHHDGWIASVSSQVNLNMSQIICFISVKCAHFQQSVHYRGSKVNLM